MKNVELMYQGVIEQKVKISFFLFLTFFLEILISLLLIAAPACTTTHIEGKDLLYKMVKDEDCGAHVSRCNRAKSENIIFSFF